MSTIVDQMHNTAMRTELPEVARMLQETIGQRLTAYAVGLKDPKRVGKWIKGESPQSDAAKDALRSLYHVVLILLETEDDETIRAWLIGANPQLGDQPPIQFLQDGKVADVLSAARVFVQAG